MPRAGNAAAPTGVVPLRVSPPHPERATAPDGQLQQLPVAPSSTSGKDAAGFLEYITEEGKPGLVSFMGNAYQARIEERAVTIFFDRTHANLIPMLRSAGQQGQLKELAAAYFKYSPEVHFAIGSDPKVVARNKEEEESMRVIREHPTIQYLLEKLNGRIINCQIMDPKE